MAKATDDPSLPLCLLEASELFSHDTVASFYYLEEGGFETLIGIGIVINVQDDRRIQVQMTRAAEGSEQIVARLAANDNSALGKVRIKPTVPRSFLEEGV
jgi:hypothetical protein